MRRNRKKPGSARRRETSAANSQNFHRSIVNATASSDTAAINIFEKQVYDLQQLLEISRSLCTTLELSKLIESILYIAMAQMRTVGAGVFIRQTLESEEYTLANNYTGLEVTAEFQYRININSEFSEKLSRLGKAYPADVFEEEFGDYEEYKILESLKPTLVVPLILKSHVNGILILGERISIDDESAAYTDYELNEIYTIASLAAIAVNNASLVEQSSTDMMTRLKLKYYFFNMLTDKIDASFSANIPLCVLMFDIDHFKLFNDNFGHACGDYVLQIVAKIIKSNIREEDMAARYGGEEFTVMLPDTGKDAALQVAERIRQAIQDYDFFYENQHMKVTISCGVSECSVENNPVSSAKILVAQADKALYVSKNNGRNRVTFADSTILNQVEAESI